MIGVQCTMYITLKGEFYMKKRGLVFGMILSLVLCLCLALFCACGGTKTNTGDTGSGDPSAQQEIYEKYVAYATAAGDDVLSYEEWLDSIRGKDGLNGKDGKDGKDGSDGQNGKDGTDGKSAYDIWLENGHSGSESDFLDWLKGEKGDTGAQGATGPQGATGATGPQGVQGEKGQDGDDGADGQDGKDGKDGKDGQNGADGKDGVNGQDGLSAFDLFKKYYPYYQGTEKDWIDDLMYDNLEVFTITFKSDVAEDILRYAFIGQALLDIPEVPEKEGQVSAKWDREDFTNITSDIEVHAVYTMKQFTVTFHNEYTEEEDETRTVEYGQAVEGVPTVKEKFGNSGVWDVTDFSRITENMTVNAVYETIGLAYTPINNQQEYRVSAGTMNKDTEELFIPSVREGKPVTVIAEEAFGSGGGYHFKCVHLPESITEIRGAAFRNCEQLQSIRIPSKVTKLDGGVFTFCTSLTNAELPNVTILGTSVFWGCEKLTTVEMPNVTSIGRYAFYWCTGLKDFEFPSGVTEIDSSVFYSCTSLEHIEIPSGVTEIPESLFDGCTSLKYVILPSGITSIGSDVFRGCSIFEAIYFKGDADRWNGIQIKESNSILRDAKVYYYAAQMPEENEGDYWHYDVDEVTPVVWKKDN